MRQPSVAKEIYICVSLTLGFSLESFLEAALVSSRLISAGKVGISCTVSGISGTSEMGDSSGIESKRDTTTSTRTDKGSFTECTTTRQN